MDGKYLAKIYRKAAKLIDQKNKQGGTEFACHAINEVAGRPLNERGLEVQAFENLMKEDGAHCSAWITHQVNYECDSWSINNSDRFLQNLRKLCLEMAAEYYEREGL